MARKKRWSSVLLSALFIAGLVIGWALTALLPAPATEPPAGLAGYVPVEINVTQTTVILTAECRQIEAETTEAQTFSIAKGLEGKLDFRPTTHDLMKDLLDFFNATVVQARIDRYASGTYYATLVISQGERILRLDSRPTDAMGVAVRYNVPVYINQTLLAERGTKVC